MILSYKVGRGIMKIFLKDLRDEKESNEVKATDLLGVADGT
ncbi:hypothetical protein RV18_GL002022 [Enterococcus termitis]|nr:hypothetical protein RV18_GL002022 [Enterococcus termitis]